MKNSRFELQYRGEKCLNCQMPLEKSDRFCHHCGQINSTKKLAFSDFFQEFFGSLFAYDSRLYRTLRTLIFHPGKISREYIQGKRVYYANPFRFYLSVSIIFFIIYGFTLGNENTPIKLNADNSEAEHIQPEDYPSDESLTAKGFFEETSTRIGFYSKFHQQHPELSIEEALQKLKHPNTNYNQWTYQKGINFDTIGSNPNSFLNYLLSKLPFVVFFFIPLFALVLWLVYARKKMNYMEHLVFAFHTQTMCFFLYLWELLLSFVTDSFLPGLLISIAFLLYLYKALRNFYQQKRLKTILKFVLLNGIFFILAILTTIAALVVSFVFY